MAAIQPWSAAGAEKPMTTFWPGAAFGLAELFWLVLTWVFSCGVLLVQAVSRVPPHRRRECAYGTKRTWLLQGRGNGERCQRLSRVVSDL
jgi:hypothetical protein